MEIVTTASIVPIERKQPTASNETQPSFYHEPPQEELTLDEFEMLSIDRLQLLRAFDNSKSKIDSKDELLKAERKYWQSIKGRTKRFSTSKKDQISHFILRIGFCHSEDRRTWFIAQECALFNYRLNFLQADERKSFLENNGVIFDEVSKEAKHEYKEFLINLAGVTEESFSKTTFYKVPFQQARKLIASKQVYLKSGYAYVPLQHLVAIVEVRFRTYLSRALTEAANSFNLVGSDTRIGSFVTNMDKQYIGNDFSRKSELSDTLTPEMVEVAAERNMPLCMKNLHVNLRKEHKLKHWGRLQYGLFLKGAGLNMESALLFWESHFSKIMNHDQFVKTYDYSFRHMYGKKGARKNYTPYSCMKIIMGTPPEVGGHHGCPYRHMSESHLTSLLRAQHLSEPNVTQIMELAKHSHYQQACQHHFDVVHPGHNNMDLKMSDAANTHPNAWFQTSVNYHKVKNGQPIDPSGNRSTPPSTASNTFNSGSATADSAKTAVKGAPTESSKLASIEG